ncbi:MAG: 5'-methylthioadenosine/S-adenosylhomocysteine nucleosidase [Thermoanaerobaculaceae bacterium]
MTASRPVAVVVPMEEELAPFRGLLEGWRRVDALAPWEAYEAHAHDRRVVLVLSDCGPVNAGAATERAIVQLVPEVILVGGSAGAHDPELLPGDVVIGAETCALHPPELQRARIARGLHPKQLRFRRDGERVHLERCESEPGLVARGLRIAGEELPRFGPWHGPGWPPGEPPRPGRAARGRIGSTDQWHADAAEIHALRHHYGTACEDMESAFVAQVCAMHRVPFLAVRGIADNEAACRLPEAEVDRAIGLAGARAAAILARLAAEI